MFKPRLFHLIWLSILVGALAACDQQVGQNQVQDQMPAAVRKVGTSPMTNCSFDSAAPGETFDIAITNGRVMDPECNYDGVRNVGIKGDRIAVITKGEVKGKKTIDAAGHTLVPGFINTHTHTFAPYDQKVMARDGTTTLIDSEMGATDMDLFYSKYKGNSLLNYGTHVGHEPIRIHVLDGVPLEVVSDPTNAVLARVRSAEHDQHNSWSVDIPTDEQHAQIMDLMNKGLEQGALGIGSTLEYMKVGVPTGEVMDLQKLVGKYNRAYGIHTRFGVGEPLPTNATLGSREALANFAAIKGGGLLLSHMQGAENWDEIYELCNKFNEQGYLVLCEYYPSGTGNPNITTPQLLKGVVGKDKNGIDIETMVINPDTGEYFDEDTFWKTQETEPGKKVFVEFLPVQEGWFYMKKVAVSNDMLVTLTSDGSLAPADMPYEEYVGHPRNPGTYGTVFRKARELNIPLMDMVYNTSYAAANFYSKLGVKAMQERGRMQEGMVADITIFNPDAITEHTSFKAGEQGLPTTGIPFVIVNGMVVVDESKVDLEIKPGQPIRYPVTTTGK